MELAHKTVTLRKYKALSTLFQIPEKNQIIGPFLIGAFCLQARKE